MQARSFTEQHRRIAPCGREVQPRRRDDTIYQLATVVAVLLLLMTGALV
jgi:hypothetical protein